MLNVYASREGASNNKRGSITQNTTFPFPFSLLWRDSKLFLLGSHIPPIPSPLLCCRVSSRSKSSPIFPLKTRSRSKSQKQEKRDGSASRRLASIPVVGLVDVGHLADDDVDVRKVFLDTLEEPPERRGVGHVGSLHLAATAGEHSTNTATDVDDN